MPYAGLVSLVKAAWLGTQSSPERRAALALPVVITAVCAVSLYYAWRRRDGLSTAAVLYALVAVSLNYGQIWSHVPSGERGTYESFLCVLLMAWMDPKASSRMLAVATGALAVYTFWASPEAGASRAALLLIR